MFSPLHTRLNCLNSNMLCRKIFYVFSSVCDSSAIRVPTQVSQSLIKSYICFSICKALQSLVFLVFSSKRSYKVLFLKGKKGSELAMWFPPWSKINN